MTATTAAATPAPGPALRAYALAELARAAACLGWRGRRLHEGVHQARKSIRRVRATVVLGATALGPGGRWVDRSLRRLNRALSTLRDAQALVETLDRLLGKASAAPVRPALRRARRAATARREERTRAALQADPALAGARTVLAGVHAALAALPWQTVAEADWRAALATTRRRVALAQARAQASGEAEDWHRWRRRARRLSQQHRAVHAAALPAPPIPAFDKSLAEQLGVAQDLSLLLEHCRRDSPFADADRLALRGHARTALARQRRRIAAVAATAGADATEAASPASTSAEASAATGAADAAAPQSRRPLRSRRAASDSAG